MRIHERSNQNNKGSRISPRIRFFTRIFSGVGLFLLFTTLLSPFWLTIVHSNTFVTVGLWNICKNQTCQKLAVNTKILQLTRGLMSVSTVSGFVAVSCVLLNKFSLKDSKLPLFTNLFTGITSLIAMVLYNLSLKFKGLLGRPVPDTTSPIYISWCFVAGCFASFLFLLNGLIFLLMVFEEDATNHVYAEERKDLDETT